MGRADFLYSGFISRLPFSPTVCQDNLLRKVADFVSSDDDDILVVNKREGGAYEILKTCGASRNDKILEIYRSVE